MIPISEINDKAKLEIYKDIHNVLDELKGTNSKSKFERLANDLNSLYDLANNYSLRDYPLYEQYISRDIDISLNQDNFNILMKHIRKLYELIIKDLEYHIEISEQSDYFEFYNFKRDYRSLSKISDYNEIFYYAKEFMNSYDPDLLKKYNDLDDKNHILINYTTEEINSTLISFYDNKTPYISLNLNHDIEASATIVHEAAHLKQDAFLRNNHAHFNYLFREVYSFYLQFVFYDYIQKQKLYQNDVNICFNHCLDDLDVYLLDLYGNLENIGNIDFSIHDNILYSYGILLGLKYYDIYKNDPEKAKYLTDQFIEQSFSYDPMTVLNSFGLNKKEIKSGKVLKKYIKNKSL